MNILILGTGLVEQSLINLCKKSKYLDKLYTASVNPLENIPNVEYEDFSELVSKAKILQIDLVLFSEKKFIEDGLVEYLKKNLINVVSVNKKWLNLETSRIVAKQLLDYYSINNQKIIKAPTTFPVVVKTSDTYKTFIANTIQDLINITESLSGRQIFLEEYLSGEIIYLTTLWDGKTALHFDAEFDYTEIQRDRLEYLKTKLNIMLSEERADFLGFFTTKLIWAKNDWYVLDFIMNFNDKMDFCSIKQDFLYILNCALYQNLNEIENA